MLPALFYTQPAAAFSNSPTYLCAPRTAHLSRHTTRALPTPLLGSPPHHTYPATLTARTSAFLLPFLFYAHAQRLPRAAQRRMVCNLITCNALLCQLISRFFSPFCGLSLSYDIKHTKHPPPRCIWMALRYCFYLYTGLRVPRSYNIIPSGYASEKIMVLKAGIRLLPADWACYTSTRHRHTPHHHDSYISTLFPLPPAYRHAYGRLSRTISKHLAASNDILKTLAALPPAFAWMESLLTGATTAAIYRCLAGSTIVAGRRANG